MLPPEDDVGTASINAEANQVEQQEEVAMNRERIVKPSSFIRRNLTSRLRRAVIAVAFAVCMSAAGTATMTIPASAQTTTAANAATTNSAIPAAQMHTARPGTTAGGPFEIWYPCQPQGSCYDNLSCNEGAIYNAPTWLAALYSNVYVVNDCTVRVWLAQYSNGTGYTFCLSPNSGKVYIYRSYKQVKISSNPNHC